MEIRITHLCNAETPFRDYFASVAELGQDAGRVTWQAALDDAPDYALFSESDCDEIRDYFRGFGAWSAEELRAMGYQELQALLLQFIAGDIRDVPSDAEAFSPEWWADYECLAECGTVSGCILRGEDGEVYYLCGE